MNFTEGVKFFTARKHLRHPAALRPLSATVLLGHSGHCPTSMCWQQTSEFHRVKRPLCGGGGLIISGASTANLASRPFTVLSSVEFNPLIATLKPQSNGPSYSNTVIVTLAVDGWDVSFGTARRGLGGAVARPGPSSLYQM